MSIQGKLALWAAPIAAAATLGLSGAPSLAQDKGPYVITQLTFGAGAATQVAAQGLRQIVNETNKKIRVEQQPGRGAQNLMYWDRRPKARNRLFVDMTTHDALYPKPKENLKPVVALIPFGGWALLTRDPNIKTLRDLEGKVVDSGGIGAGAAGGQLLMDMMKRIGLDTSKVDWSKQTTTLTARSDQLADGISDAAHSGVIAKRMVSPAPLQVMRQKKLYFVDFGKENILPFAPATVPYAICPGDVQKQYKLDYDPNQGRKVYVMYTTPSTWASTDVPEWVVYEYVSAVIKKRAEFKNYLPRLGRLLSVQLGHVPVAQSEFHPGAARAFREAGMTFGLEGMAEWESKQKGICQ